MHSLFFLYANIFLSRFQPLFELPKNTLFVKCFEAVQYTRGSCFIGLQGQLASPRGFYFNPQIAHIYAISCQYTK